MNSFSASFPEVWAKEQQTIFYKKNVAMEIADTSFRELDWYGQILSRTYINADPSDAPGVYSPGTDLAQSDTLDTKESLTVNKQFAELTYIDDYEQIQSRYNIAMTYGKKMAMRLTNQVDADVLGEAVNATSTVDAGSIWGTSGQWIILSIGNVFQVITAVQRKLDKLNVVETDKYGVVSPEFTEVVNQYYADRNTSLGDTASEKGYFKTINGFKMYTSNLITGSAVLYLATTPTDGDTVTIAGQVFTFKTTLGTTAGNVLIWGSADVARANLAALLNAPWTTTANGVAIGATTTQAYKRFAARVTATNDNTADTLSVVYKWAGTLVVSETLTAAADVWTTTLQKQICLFGVKGNPVLVIQRQPSVVVKEEPKRLWKNILNGVLYWVKTFSDNAKCMVRVDINSSLYSA